MPLTKNDTPLGLVELFEEAYPSMDLLRRDKCGNVPQECYIPIAAGMAVATEILDLDRIEATMIASEITGLYIWNKSKIMYRFDDALTEALAAQAKDIKDTDVLPINLLLHPPYPCVYVKSGYFREYYGMDGFFTWIEWDTNREEFELRWQLVSEDMDASIGFTMHLSKTTIGECLAETAKETERWEWVAKERKVGVPENEFAKNAPPSSDGESDSVLPSPIALMLEMVLYLSADNRDEEEDRGQRAANRRAKAKSKTWRKQNTPDSIRLSNVGVRVGAALRKAKGTAPSSESGTGTGAKKITHLRRGHWHHYWIGPKADPEQRKLILKWTAPTVINPPDDDDTESNVVIYPVR